MTMNALESFIDFCDDMTIVTEAETKQYGEVTMTMVHAKDAKKASSLEQILKLINKDTPLIHVTDSGAYKEFQKMKSKTSRSSFGANVFHKGEYPSGTNKNSMNYTTIKNKQGTFLIHHFYQLVD